MGLLKAISAVGLAAACAGAVVFVTPSVVPAASASESPTVTPSGSPLASASPAFTELAASRPNVVIIYLDDVSPDTSRLWSKRKRTPELARFTRDGVEFSRAITSTPLCGPSRATLLTGQFSHNHSVTDNRASRFSPSGTLAPALSGAGYHTVLAGKYLNGLDEAAPRSSDVERYAEGWDDFDVIWTRQQKGQGQFYGYDLWTREGVTSRDYRPRDHSTNVVGRQVAQRIREAPADEPVFALASFAAGHVPHTPLARHEGSKACRGIGTYRSKSYDERNVSDKPAYIRRLPRLSGSAVSLRPICEEMLGVDEALARIRDALDASGRLDDTLFIFTADNGFLLGDHRAPLPGVKNWPHSVDVPLYMLWPAVLGSERRVIGEPVSNVDLPVTICALAGCELADADGMDLTPLLSGETDQLEREFLYTEMLRRHEGMPPWYGLVTTGAYDPETTWQYAEYSGGGRELYDLTTDPDRLRNLARKPEHKKRVRQLHRQMLREFVGPGEVQLS